MGVLLVISTVGKHRIRFRHLAIEGGANTMCRDWTDKGAA
jgi:hypothetical protein